MIDSDAENLTVEDLLGKIKERKPHLVGTTAATPTFSQARNLIRRIRNLSSCQIVLGGYHLTALPEEVMSQCPADFGVYGEGEETIVELAAALGSNNSGVGFPALKFIRGLIWRDGQGRIIINAPRDQIVDLDNLPYPGRDLLRINKYKWSVPHKGWRPVTSIVSQRGCPYQCVFCGVQTMFPKVRYRNISSVVDELEYIKKELNIDHILFQDDTLTLNSDKVLEMCEIILERHLSLTWEGYTRADTVSKNLLSKMKRAGLVRLSFGVESGEEYILRAIKKNLSPETLRQAYEWAAELGLETRCSFMIGHPFETRNSIEKTIEFVKSLRCYQAYINISTPYPGSELLKMAQKGVGGLKLLTTDWNEYRRYGNAVVEMNDLRREDLIHYQKLAYRRFYLRPHIIWYNLRRSGLLSAVLNVWGFARSIFR